MLSGYQNQNMSKTRYTFLSLSKINIYIYQVTIYEHVTLHRTMQWLERKMSRMKSTKFWTTDRLTHRNWSLLDDSGGWERVLTDVDGEGRGYLDGLRFRHSWSDTEAWPVRCCRQCIPRCRPYHPLLVKYEDDRASKRNQWEK